MMGLTARQQECLHLIDAGLRNTGRSPSTAELAEGLALKSKSGVCKLLDGLEERGVIRRLKRKARSIQIIDPGEVKLNSDIFKMVQDYAAKEHKQVDTIVNEALAEWLGVAA